MYTSIRVENVLIIQGQIQGGVHQKFSCLPPQLEKIWFFGVKSLFFTRNTPKIFTPPSARCNFFKCTPPNLKSWIHPCYYCTITWKKYWYSQYYNTHIYLFCETGRNHLLLYLYSLYSYQNNIGSWIYNYLCNQCLSPLTASVRIQHMVRCTRYNIMW